jgi:hypothetical protein
MPRWDIDPAGVRAVVVRTAGAAEDLGREVGSLVHALAGAAGTSGSGIVAQALNDFAAYHAPAVEAVRARTERALNGAVEATGAYLRGDEEMAARAQQAAVGGRRSGRAL